MQSETKQTINRSSLSFISEQKNGGNNKSIDLSNLSFQLAQNNGGNSQAQQPINLSSVSIQSKQKNEGKNNAKTEEKEPTLYCLLFESITNIYDLISDIIYYFGTPFAWPVLKTLTLITLITSPLLFCLASSLKYWPIYKSDSLPYNMNIYEKSVKKVKNYAQEESKGFGKSSFAQKVMCFPFTLLIFIRIAVLHLAYFVASFVFWALVGIFSFSPRVMLATIILSMRLDSILKFQKNQEFLTKHVYFMENNEKKNIEARYLFNIILEISVESVPQLIIQVINDILTHSWGFLEISSLIAALLEIMKVGRSLFYTDMGNRTWEMMSELLRTDAIGRSLTKHLQTVISLIILITSVSVISHTDDYSQYFSDKWYGIYKNECESRKIPCGSNLGYFKAHNEGFMNSSFYDDSQTEYMNLKEHIILALSLSLLLVLMTILRTRYKHGQISAFVLLFVSSLFYVAIYLSMSGALRGGEGVILIVALGVYLLMLIVEFIWKAFQKE